MRHLIEKHGFVYCGIIIVDDLTPRLAFQKKKKIRQKILAIVGPTAVGKTAFGIRCASQFNGEIISGDSIQIYRGLDIGSAKPDSEELSQAVHHLIDIKDPDDHYSVKEFQELCREKINEISEKGKLPIIVGGTGLYIKAALYDYKFFEEETKDEQYEDLSNEELYQLLETKDPKALEKIHVNNRKRLIRALNIYEKHNKGISEIKDEQEHKPIYDCLIIGLTAERQILFERINERVDRMIENGLIEEIEGLLNKGISFSDQSMQGIGYKEFKAYFDKDKSLEECIEDVKINSRHFAKRQYTFFNNQLDVKWYDDKDKAIQEVREWLI
ncbi:MAG: tRNA (adenosine(37)-N6)-dimethylallyltransferase MiaA [Erysipelotrichaceae bacterium]|nr:tRNA (adenosine(37)-N6)-dimethylallyltransferase MiaA [Erysipelotrichaceae bacterium]